MTDPIRLSILGATGSIGKSTLEVVAAADPDAFEIKALTANQNVDALALAARRHNAEIAVIANPDLYNALSQALQGTSVQVAAGESGLQEAADRDVDSVMAAIVGAAGLRPALQAARRAKRLAIANKECLVIAGNLFLAELAKTATELIPVDSEHAAVFQILNRRDPATVARVLLTASGGPFREWSAERLKTVAREDALQHPNWSMGAKITVDSATLMNKGLELIEAYHLFGLDGDRFDAIVHPQSIVHALVELSDSSVLAQLAYPDMRMPIAQSLYWPAHCDQPAERFNFEQLSQLTFEPIDHARFPAFSLAQQAMKRGGSAPAVLNGANEAAVAAFLDREIHFLDIATTVADTMTRAEGLGLLDPCSDIDAALMIDTEARKLARDVMGNLCK